MIRVHVHLEIIPGGGDFETSGSHCILLHFPPRFKTTLPCISCHPRGWHRTECHPTSIARAGNRVRAYDAHSLHMVASSLSIQSSVNCRQISRQVNPVRRLRSCRRAIDQIISKESNCLLLHLFLCRHNSRPTSRWCASYIAFSRFPTRRVRTSALS